MIRLEFQSLGRSCFNLQRKVFFFLNLNQLACCKGCLNKLHPYSTQRTKQTQTDHRCASAHTSLKYLRCQSKPCTCLGRDLDGRVQPINRTAPFINNAWNSCMGIRESHSQSFSHWIPSALPLYLSPAVHSLWTQSVVSTGRRIMVLNGAQ